MLLLALRDETDPDIFYLDLLQKKKKDFVSRLLGCLDKGKRELEARDRKQQQEKKPTNPPSIIIDHSSMTAASDSTSLSYLRPEVAALKEDLDAFVENDCIPAEASFFQHVNERHGTPSRFHLDAVPPCLEQLKQKAKQLGLWNIFIPPHLIGKVPDPSLAPKIALSYREYGVLCESLGRCPHLAPEACNTSAPDTGNMEVLLEFGTPQQKHDYLLPLLRGEIRSTFLMTEPAVASSDPTNLQTKLTKRMVRQPDGSIAAEYTLTGEKWWSTGAMDPRCRVALVVAKMDYSELGGEAEAAADGETSQHGAHTIVAVPLPHPGVRFVRALTVMGYDDAPSGHAHVVLDNVQLTARDLILGEGSGFAVSQARLGPGRIHHCMRAVGMGECERIYKCMLDYSVIFLRNQTHTQTEPKISPSFFFIAARCYELMLQRSLERKTFGKYLCQHGGTQEMIADSVIDLEAARLLTLSCAAAMDDLGVKRARHKIASVKVAVPRLTYAVVDRAVQLFGGAGVEGDSFLAQSLAGLRTLRLADGPDAVHKRTVARLEVRRVAETLQSRL